VYLPSFTSTNVGCTAQHYLLYVLHYYNYHHHHHRLLLKTVDQQMKSMLPITENACNTVTLLDSQLEVLTLNELPFSILVPHKFHLTSFVACHCLFLCLKAIPVCCNAGCRWTRQKTGLYNFSWGPLESSTNQNNFSLLFASAFLLFLFNRFRREKEGLNLFVILWRLFRTF
jgi:hypothetical protein